MQAHEQAQFLSAISTFVQEQVAKSVQAAITPLQTKIEELEAQLSLRPVIDPADVVEQTFDSVMKNIPAPKEPDIDRASIAALIEHERKTSDEMFGQLAANVKEINDKIDALPQPKDGKDAEIPWDYLNKQLSAAADMQIRHINKKIDSLPKPRDGMDGKDGKDAEVNWEDVRGVIAALVDEHFEKYPVKDGKDGADGKDGRDGSNGADGESVSLDELGGMCRDLVAEAVGAMPDPLHVVSGHVDRDGCLHFVRNDGSAFAVGNVVGRDASREDVVMAVEKVLATWPRPADGKDGKDGKDGVDLTHATITRIGDRNFILSFSNEARDKQINLEFSIPAQVNKGMWSDEVEYVEGDIVTLGGSQWCARTKTRSRPETGNEDWHLVVKRGRDGKVGPVGPKGIDGKDGKPGRDLTQVLFSGEKI